MGVKGEAALVQGTVTFTVSCNDLMGLVDTDTANSDYKLKEWLQDTAFKSLDNADVEVEIDNVEPVTISKETYDKHKGKLLTDEGWKEIKKEDKETK